MPRKIKIKLSELFRINKVFPFGAVKLHDDDDMLSHVNKQRLNHYFGKEERNISTIILKEPS